MCLKNEVPGFETSQMIAESKRLPKQHRRSVNPGQDTLPVAYAALADWMEYSAHQKEKRAMVALKPRLPGCNLPRNKNRTPEIFVHGD